MLDLREFLDHLAWYWIVARHSQALKVQDDRNEDRLRPIIVTKAEELLRRLYELQEKIAAGKTAAVKYSAPLGAIRITRAEFRLTLGPKFGDDDFSNLFSGKGRPFFDRVRGFVNEETYKSWRRNELLDLKEADDLRSFLGPWLPAAAPPFFQTLLQWNERRGVTWLMFRDLSLTDAAQFPNWSQERLNALLGADRVLVHEHVRTARQPWIQRAILDDVDRSLFNVISRELIATALGAAIPDDGIIRDGIGGLPGPTRMLTLPEDGAPPLAPQGVKSTLVITGGTYADAVRRLPVPSRDHAYAIFDQESMWDFLSVQPWVWSKHAGPVRTFAVCKTVDDVAQVLACHPIAAHPLVRRYEFPRSPSLTCIIGRFGSGRTTVLVQLTERLRDHVVVVLRETLTTDDFMIAESLLRTLEADICVLIDDADLYHELGPQLARLARAAMASRYTRRFLVAGGSLSRRSIAQSCEAARQLLHADLVTINSLSEDAFTSVSNAARSPADAHLNDETIEALRLFETTPRVITDWVDFHQQRDWSFGEHEAFIAAAHARLSRWQSAYEQLPDVSREVLRCIAALRCLLHWSELPLIRELVADAVAFTTAHPAHESFRALRNLELDGWLREKSEGFQIDDICLLTPINEFLDMKEGLGYLEQSLLDPFVWRVVEWLPEGSRRLALAQRDAVLGTAALALRYFEPDPLTRRTLTERMLAERPDVPAVHSTLVDALVELGEIENAIAHIERVGKLAWQPLATLPAILQLLETRQRAFRAFESIESSEKSNCTPRLQRSGLIGRIRVDPEISPRHAVLAELLERQQVVPIADFTRDGPMFLEHYLDGRRRVRRSAQERSHDLAQLLTLLHQQAPPNS